MRHCVDQDGLWACFGVLLRLINRCEKVQPFKVASFLVFEEKGESMLRTEDDQLWECGCDHLLQVFPSLSPT